MSSGSTRNGSGAGISTATRSPLRTGWALLLAAPFTRTRPASISCFARERVPTAGTAARNRSRRCPAASLGTTSSTRPGAAVISRGRRASARRPGCGAPAPAPVADHDPPAKRVGPAEQAACPRHVAGTEQLAEPGAAHLLVVAGDGDGADDGDAEAEGCAQGA